MGLNKIIFSLLFFSAFSIPLVSAQQVSLEVEGSCRDYAATVTAEGFDRGCYDVKVDVSLHGERVGEILDSGRWKSSFFYIENGFCVEIENKTTSAAYQLKADTNQREIIFEGSLRNGTKTWDSEEIAVEQNCPRQDELLFLPVALLVILLLLIGIAIHLNWRERKGRNIKQEAK